MTLVTVEIKGMHCQSCKMLITDILEDEGVKIQKFDVDTQQQTGSLIVDTDKSKSAIVTLVKSAGEYTVK